MSDCKYFQFVLRFEDLGGKRRVGVGGCEGGCGGIVWLSCYFAYFGRWILL
jgi:hypothetical protein